MTNYGTIPTSTYGSTSTNLDFISSAKDRIRSNLATRRPWRSLFPDFHCLGIPHGFSDALSRVRTNFAYFRMNYAIIVLFVLFVSLLWHPISLIVFIAMMAAWMFLYFLRDQPLEILHRTINDRIVLIVLSVVTIVLLLLTHATWEIVGAVCVGVFVVLIHAVFRKTEDLFVDEGDLNKQPLVSSSASSSH
ncbi:hypothetical protein GIB67_021846 [Kingdonia uniflora]|uniref:PRA1 family protein n=1 Tax=Kingdonia uniflora TaxID=39325 RepID=A0A7J7P7D4_9MAGN|nr:hypothetical protein GIB67_021846 [Kingdonia uniflora]